MRVLVDTVEIRSIECEYMILIHENRNLTLPQALDLPGFTLARIMTTDKRAQTGFMMIMPACDLSQQILQEGSNKLNATSPG